MIDQHRAGAAAGHLRPETPEIAVHPAPPGERIQGRGDLSAGAQRIKTEASPLLKTGGRLAEKSNRRFEIALRIEGVVSISLREPDGHAPGEGKGPEPVERFAEPAAGGADPAGLSPPAFAKEIAGQQGRLPELSQEGRIRIEIAVEGVGRRRFQRAELDQQLPCLVMRGEAALLKGPKERLK